MTEIDYSIQNNPDKQELDALFREAFGGKAFEADDQKLEEWFDLDAMIEYLPYGELIEARLGDNGKLVGAVFTAKQHPITYPDGNKWEIFILGVLPGHVGQGIGTELLRRAEGSAKVCGAKALIINTHHEVPQLHDWYKSRGYEQIGVLEKYYDNGNAVFFKKDLLN